MITGRFPLIGWVAVAGLVLCIVSLLVLTVLLPGQGTYPPNGGLLPLTPSGQVR